MSRKINILDYGRTHFKEAFDVQLEMIKKRREQKIKDTLILTEHYPVITLGRSGDENNLLVSREELESRGIEFQKINRGGDITYHGPGQLVGYPILKLANLKKDLHWLMRKYEEVFLRLLKEEFGIKGKRIEGETGVWVENNKITAIGIGAKRWISFHGFAFNIDPNMKHFELINPCGITDKGVTSLKKERPDLKISREELKTNLAKHFCSIFDLEVDKVEKRNTGMDNEECSSP